jgi:hypothetical protein
MTDMMAAVEIVVEIAVEEMAETSGDERKMYSRRNETLREKTAS